MARRLAGLTAVAWLEPITLHGSDVTLEPLGVHHGADLSDAVRDGELWRLWYTDVPSPEGMAREIERRLGLQAQGSMLPFTVIDKHSGRAVGMTTYTNAEPEHRRLEIGWTWYGKSVQRTGLNTQCKLLLLTHAFETLACIAVEFRTHFFNRQSRLGIERLGAKLDGILRNHKRLPDGTLRDTCVYSIVASEWPAVQNHLTWEATRPRPTRPTAR